MESEYGAAAVCTALMRVGSRMAVGFDKRFAELGITQAKFRTLLVVAEEAAGSGITPSDLADRLLIERASVSSLVKGLVERGLVARVPGENRRTYGVVLTAAGADLLEVLVPRAVELANQTMADVGEPELRLMHAGLERVESRLRARAHEG
jgi:DNA-binding MarR family transcriptional regulator